jgi:GAF domain-containing protein
MASSDLAAHLADAARTMTQPRSLDETLQTIVAAAVRSVPGFDAVGIAVIGRRGMPHTRASTSDLVNRLDDVQYGLGEGPCAEAIKGADMVIAPHLRHEQRWPRYVPQAVQEGLRSQLAVRLHAGEGTVGGLNLYSTVADEVEPEAESLAALFATHAAIALGHAQERDNLNRALQSRTTVGQAIGIVMERYRMDEDRAFGFLVRTSTTSNLKLRDIAQAIVDQGNAT